jgi:hypothetical protein
VALVDNGEIELYGYRFRTTPEPIQESLVSVFPGKITIGDSRRTDDPIASSYVMQDWTGGGLKRWMDPSVDFDRFYWSDCATWFTRQLTLGPLTRTVVPTLGTPGAPAVAVGGGGSIGPSFTLQVAVSYTNAGGLGETPISPLTPVSFAGLDGMTITSPPVIPGATGYFVYVSPFGGLGLPVVRTATDTTSIATPVAIGVNCHISVQNASSTQIGLPAVNTALLWSDGLTRNIRAGADYNGVQYLAWDERLALLDLNEVLQDKGAITTSPNIVTDMRVFRMTAGANSGLSRLVFAFGPSGGGPATGYATYDGTTLTAGVGGETCLFMTQWDDKLVKLGDDGALRYTTDLSQWFNLPGQNKVPVTAANYTGLAVFPDAMWGLDSLQIATTTGLYFYDDIAQAVRSTRFSNLPRLIDQGRHITNHKDELYIPSVGVGIDRYSGTTVSAVGLNKDDGLPGAYRGNLQWLASSINFLVAAVSSTVPIAANNAIFGGDEIMSATNVGGTQGYAALYGEPRIGGGWHTLYASPLQASNVYWTGVSSADHKYRLFFGTNGTLGIIDQYPDIANMLDNTIQEFNPSGSLITPWNEMGWSEIQKQAIRQKFGVKGAGLIANGTTCTGTPCNIVVEYGLDYDETNWHSLATLTTAVPPAAYFGVSRAGISLTAIRYRFTLNRCSNTFHTPVLVWSTMTFLKQMDARWGYRFTLDLTTNEQGITPADQADLLRRMCDPHDLGNSQGLFRGWVNGKFQQRYVSVSELVGKVKGGNKQSGVYSVALVAFP